ncbi:protein FAR1-RELATED SEQUENCE 4-like [Juglans microcarpa x Juglans regia]|uniref:protein FAR1-RELATED SEQUENCE 4-like n=1 Tax=Juglans microcarpa x Juglans regia TaxID=2249226 RepID=UPI001B7F0468|nr:protein FAR1-RELATED SEQUENCE 4-like [Juglans microcarpa x Juglans regia]
MNGRSPKAIITDQDLAMKNAIDTVFLDTRHRYCLWHIMQKLPEKLGSYSQFNSGLKSSIQSALYDSPTCTKFEDKWGQLLHKYDLQNNAWLQGLYEERRFWVPIYLKSVFWVGMSMTQHSESINAFFDRFVHSGTTLKEFVYQFDNVLRKKVEVEATTDFNSLNQTTHVYPHLKLRNNFKQCIQVLSLKRSKKSLKAFRARLSALLKSLQLPLQVCNARSGLRCKSICKSIPNLLRSIKDINCSENLFREGGVNPAKKGLILLDSNGVLRTENFLSLSIKKAFCWAWLRAIDNA